MIYGGLAHRKFGKCAEEEDNIEDNAEAPQKQAVAIAPSTARKAKKKAKKAEPKTSIGKYNLHGSHLNHQQELCRQQAHSWQLDAYKHQTKAIIDAIHDKAFTTTATI